MDAKDITDKLSIKFQGLAFDDHEDEVVRRGIRCKGNERWIDGTIQAVEFPMVKSLKTEGIRLQYD